MQHGLHKDSERHCQWKEEKEEMEEEEGEEEDETMTQSQCRHPTNVESRLIKQSKLLG